MSAEDDAFLSRWSRRKLEARRTPEPESAPPEEPSGDAELSPELQTQGEPELTPDEIAALPSIEEITPDTDITGFLRKGVPDALRNAALRRMWAADPMVRDYVGDARDYAWDWNVPGGVPGNGPLLPNADTEEAVSRILSPDPAAPQPRRDVAAGEATGEGTGPAVEDGTPAPEVALNSVRRGGPPELGADRVAEPPEAAPLGPTPDPAPPRRHGRAAPV